MMWKRDGVRVLLSENIWQFDFEAALAEVSDQRREQALKFRHEQGRRLSVLAYRLLQRALQQEFGIAEPPVFCYAEHGKPSIVGRPDIFFSLSHCREAAVCAVSRRPVGIDVEGVRHYSESLARYTMNDDELRLIQSAADPALAFTRLWTMKEATLKMLGTGITNDLKTVLPTPHRLTTTVAPDARYVCSLCEL